MIVPTAVRLYDAWNRRMKTSVINEWLATVVAHHPPPPVQVPGAAGGGKARPQYPSLKYATQTGAI